MIQSAQLFGHYLDMIIKWHQAGYSLDEIAPLMPQVPKEEIKAIIQHTRE